jgi:hypothetical protein
MHALPELRSPAVKRTPLARKTPLRPKQRMLTRKAPKKARQDAGYREVKPPHGFNVPKRAERHAGDRPRATPEERAHLGATAALGCIACFMDTGQFVACNVHHLRAGLGRSQRASHFEVLPLCEGHHQGNIDTSKVAFHRAPKTFELRYGTEVQLLQTVYKLLGKDFESIPELRRSIGWEGTKAYPRWWDAYKRGVHDLDNRPEERIRTILAS